MDSSIDPQSLTVAQLLWSSDPSTQNAIGLLLASALVALIFVHAPLLIRLFRIAMLHRSVRGICQADDRPASAHRQEIAAVFAGSPLAWQWEEFLYRWRAALVEGQKEHAPVRFSEILDERPLLPSGFRRSLLPALPGLFMAVGILGTLAGMATAIDTSGLGAQLGDRAELVGLLAGQVGMALRAALWGLMLAISAVLVERLIVGGFEHHAECLDLWVERAFGSLSPGEMANFAARSQRETLQQLAGELTRFTNDLTERLDRGLQRIEHSTANAASLVSEEQRGVLQSVVRQLSVQIQQGVEDHLGALHGVLDRAVDHQGTVTGGLSEAFNVMASQTEAHTRVTHVLEQAASSVDSAARSLSGTAQDFGPVLERLRDVGGTLAQTATTMDHTQQVVAHSADGVRSSIEHAAAAMNEQRDFIDAGLGEIRATIELMSNGLGENLTQALRRVDDVLGHTVGRLRETLGESNETIDRMAGPMRAAEGTTREMHTALERVRGEIVGLGDWLAQAIKPVRQSLGQIEERTNGVTRAMVEFGDRAHTVDKTMDALRGEIHEESRRFRESTAELGRHLKRAADVISESERAAAPARPEAPQPAPRPSPAPLAERAASPEPIPRPPALESPHPPAPRPAPISASPAPMAPAAELAATDPLPRLASASDTASAAPLDATLPDTAVGAAAGPATPDSAAISAIELDSAPDLAFAADPAPGADPEARPEQEAEALDSSQPLLSSPDLLASDAPSEPILSEYTPHLELSSFPPRPRTEAADPSRPQLGDSTVGRALGPDPYARMGEKTTESAALEYDEGAPDPNSLSGLLGRSPSDADTAPDVSHAETSDRSRAAATGGAQVETSAAIDDGANEPPRSWRFLGKE